MWMFDSCNHSLNRQTCEKCKENFYREFMQRWEDRKYRVTPQDRQRAYIESIRRESLRDGREAERAEILKVLEELGEEPPYDSGIVIDPGYAAAIRQVIGIIRSRS